MGRGGVSPPTLEAAQSIQPSAQGSTLISTSPSTRVGLFSCRGHNTATAESKPESTPSQLAASRVACAVQQWVESYLRGSLCQLEIMRVNNMLDLLIYWFLTRHPDLWVCQLELDCCVSQAQEPSQVRQHSAIMLLTCGTNVLKI